MWALIELFSVHRMFAISEWDGTPLQINKSVYASRLAAMKSFFICSCSPINLPTSQTMNGSPKNRTIDQKLINFPNDILNIEWAFEFENMCAISTKRRIIHPIIFNLNCKWLSQYSQIIIHKYRAFSFSIHKNRYLRFKIEYWRLLTIRVHRAYSIVFEILQNTSLKRLSLFYMINWSARKRKYRFVVFCFCQENFTWKNPPKGRDSNSEQMCKPLSCKMRVSVGRFC